MTRPKLIAAACLLDWIAGDPEWLPHPVRLIGRAIEITEPVLRRPEQSSGEKLLAGATLTAGLAVATYAATARVIAWPGLELLLAWTCLASRNLVDESLAVIRALDQADLPLARQRLSRIVGRDTHALSDTEIHRALIETLAESACDGIVAPLMYMAIGGAPLAMTYKTINTLDSMIGHADQQYFYFGKAAARLDDLANYLPSRLTAIAIAAVAGRRSTLRIWWRDGGKHKSPNAGQSESAMAGALEVCLGGENTYAGERISTPLLGAEFAQPSLRHAKIAVKIVTAVSLLAAIVAIAVSHRKHPVPIN
jgi:adenosylcobinamide-phosphate synthase